MEGEIMVNELHIFKYLPGKKLVKGILPAKFANFILLLSYV